jgi:hypothetical protein
LENLLFGYIYHINSLLQLTHQSKNNWSNFIFY